MDSGLDVSFSDIFQVRHHRVPDSMDFSYLESAVLECDEVMIRK